MAKRDAAGDDAPTIDEYLDCTGQRRRFQLRLYAEGLFLEAVELRDGESTGLRFTMPVLFDRLPPYGEIRDRIRERLSQRDLARDPDSGRLQNLHRRIRVQCADRDEDGTPSLLVDDMKISWADLGRILATYEGWGLRIEICDCGTE